jgi:hypothetical protein
MDSPLGTRHTALRPQVKEITDIVHLKTGAWIILGEPGFNDYAQDLLECLYLDYGIRSEGEKAFPLFLKQQADGEDIYSLPGCFF